MRASSTARAGIPAAVLILLKLFLAALSLIALAWLFLHLHPDTGSLAPQSRKSTADLSRTVDQQLTRYARGALDGIAVIEKTYSIPEEDLIAPRPNEALFGETDDPAVIQAVIEKAAPLLEGQELVWNPDIELMEGSVMRYYCDETILVICWKEGIDHHAVSFAEIKVADGSQIRRALAGGSYGSSVQLKASDMARSVNAVAAINGDFYAYRRLGITVYQRRMYRNAPDKVETAFFTASGDMLFSHMGELRDGDEAERFIEENDVVFAVAFGPILVENGQLRQISTYPIGEIDAQYSRAVIAQKDSLHYLLMTMGQEGRYTHRSPVTTAAQLIYERGVQNAYTLDGGQTATLVFHGTPFNRVDWDAERAMSDIIYFATAIPEEEWQT